MLTEGLDDIEERPFTSGGFRDVYRATYKGQLVAVKTLKTTSTDHLEKVYKVGGLIFCTIMRSIYIIFQRFAKGVVGWKWLQHENILSFVGVTSTAPLFLIVSAWMENGNIMSFIKTTPDQNPFSLVGVTVLYIQ